MVESKTEHFSHCPPGEANQGDCLKLVLTVLTVLKLITINQNVKRKKKITEGIKQFMDL